MANTDHGKATEQHGRGDRAQREVIRPMPTANSQQPTAEVTETEARASCRAFSLAVPRYCFDEGNGRRHKDWPEPDYRDDNGMMAKAKRLLGKFPMTGESKVRGDDILVTDACFGKHPVVTRIPAGTSRRRQTGLTRGVFLAHYCLCEKHCLKERLMVRFWRKYFGRASRLKAAAWMAYKP